MKVSKSVLALAAQVLAASKAGELAELPSADLLKFFNDNAEKFGEKPVKKFANREKTEARVIALSQTIEAAASAPAKEQVASDLGAAVAATWADPTVRAARTARHAVKADGVEYRSVGAAFVALGLELNKRSRFRRDLVAAGKAEFAGHKFALA